MPLLHGMPFTERGAGSGGSLCPAYDHFHLCRHLEMQHAAVRRNSPDSASSFASSSSFADESDTASSSTSSPANNVPQILSSASVLRCSAKLKSKRSRQNSLRFNAANPCCSAIQRGATPSCVLHTVARHYRKNVDTRLKRCRLVQNHSDDKSVNEVPVRVSQEEAKRCPAPIASHTSGTPTRVSCRDGSPQFCRLSRLSRTSHEACMQSVFASSSLSSIPQQCALFPSPLSAPVPFRFASLRQGACRRFDLSNSSNALDDPSTQQSRSVAFAHEKRQRQQKPYNVNSDTAASYNGHHTSCSVGNNQQTYEVHSLGPIFPSSKNPSFVSVAGHSDNSSLYPSFQNSVGRGSRRIRLLTLQMIFLFIFVAAVLAGMFWHHVKVYRVKLSDIHLKPRLYHLSSISSLLNDHPRLKTHSSLFPFSCVPYMPLYNLGSRNSDVRSLGHLLAIDLLEQLHIVHLLPEKAVSTCSNVTDLGPFSVQASKLKALNYWPNRADIKFLLHITCAASNVETAVTPFSVCNAPPYASDGTELPPETVHFRVGQCYNMILSDPRYTANMTASHLVALVHSSPPKDASLNRFASCAAPDVSLNKQTYFSTASQDELSSLPPEPRSSASWWSHRSEESHSPLSIENVELLNDLQYAVNRFVLEHPALKSLAHLLDNSGAVPTCTQPYVDAGFSANGPQDFIKHGDKFTRQTLLRQWTAQLERYLSCLVRHYNLEVFSVGTAFPRGFVFDYTSPFWFNAVIPRLTRSGGVAPALLHNEAALVLGKTSANTVTRCSGSHSKCPTAARSSSAWSSPVETSRALCSSHSPQVQAQNEIATLPLDDQKRASSQKLQFPLVWLNQVVDQIKALYTPRWDVSFGSLFMFRNRVLGHLSSSFCDPRRNNSLGCSKDIAFSTEWLVAPQRSEFTSVVTPQPEADFCHAFSQPGSSRDALPSERTTATLHRANTFFKVSWQQLLFSLLKRRSAPAIPSKSATARPISCFTSRRPANLLDMKQYTSNRETFSFSSDSAFYLDKLFKYTAGLVSPSYPFSRSLQRLLSTFWLYLLLVMLWSHSIFSPHPLTLVHFPRLMVYASILLYRYFVLYGLGNKLVHSIFDNRLVDYSDHIVLYMCIGLIVSIEVAAAERSHSRRRHLDSNASTASAPTVPPFTKPELGNQKQTVVLHTKNDNEDDKVLKTVSLESSSDAFPTRRRMRLSSVGHTAKRQKSTTERQPEMAIASSNCLPRQTACTSSFCCLLQRLREFPNLLIALLLKKSCRVITGVVDVPFPLLFVYSYGCFLFSTLCYSAFYTALFFHTRLETALALFIGFLGLYVPLWVLVQAGCVTLDQLGILRHPVVVSYNAVSSLPFPTPNGVESSSPLLEFTPRCAASS